MLCMAAGISEGMTTKLLSPVEMPVRLLTPMTFDAILGTIGLKLIVVEDMELFERTKKASSRRPTRRSVDRAGA